MDIALIDLTPPAVVPEQRPLLIFNPGAHETGIKDFIKNFKPCEVPFRNLRSRNLTNDDIQNCFIDMHSSQHTSKFDRELGFVIGSVREPCQEYLSIWKAASGEDSQVLAMLDKQGAPQHLYGSSPPYFDSITDTENFQVWASHPTVYGTVSKRFYQSYSETLLGVDCMVFMESFETSFLSCIHKYEEQGGFVDWNSTKLQLLQTIEDKKADIDETEERADGKDPSCNAYFDQGLKTLIENGPESAIYKQLGYGSCCSKDHFHEPLLASSPPAEKGRNDFDAKWFTFDLSAIFFTIILLTGVIGAILSVRFRNEPHLENSDSDGLANWANPSVVFV